MKSEIVYASSPQEAIEKSGFTVGQPALVTELTASHAGRDEKGDKYVVIPSVIPIPQVEAKKEEQPTI